VVLDLSWLVGLLLLVAPSVVLSEFLSLILLLFLLIYSLFLTLATHLFIIALMGVLIFSLVGLVSVSIPVPDVGVTDNNSVGEFMSGVDLDVAAILAAVSDDDRLSSELNDLRV